MPPVLAWQASVSAGSSLARVRNSRVPSVLSACGRRTSASSLSSASAGSALGRVAIASSSGTPSIRLARKARKRRDGSSAHCDVVADQHQRALGGQPGHEPREPVQQRQQLVGLRPQRLREDRLGQLRRAGERLRPHDGVEQLVHDAERERRLELGPARAEHAGLTGAGAQLPQQLRLAQTGGGLDHHHPARAAERGAQRVVEGCALSITLDELVHAPILTTRAEGG